MKSNKFFGKPTEFLRWAEHSEWTNPSWCAKHWMPCPVQGYNGIKASLLLMELVLPMIPAVIISAGPDTMNHWLTKQGQRRPMCCRIGERKMAEIWEQCQGSGEQDAVV